MRYSVVNPENSIYLPTWFSWIVIIDSSFFNRSLSFFRMTDNSSIVLRWAIVDATTALARKNAESGVFTEEGFKWWDRMPNELLNCKFTYCRSCGAIFPVIDFLESTIIITTAILLSMIRSHDWFDNVFFHFIANVCFRIARLDGVLGNDMATLTLRCDADHYAPWKCEVEASMHMLTSFGSYYRLASPVFCFSSPVILDYAIAISWLAK